MILDDIDLFSSLEEKEKEHISLFFQEYYLEKGKKLLEIGDELKGVYFLEKGQILVSDKNRKGLGFISPNAVIGVSIIYDFSKKYKISDINLDAFQDCYFLIIPIDIIKQLTDKDRIIFSKIIHQIRKEKMLFNENVIL